MEYNADVFEATTIRRMLDHFNAVLVTAVHAPAQRLDAFLAELGRPGPTRDITPC
jgi:hypothetical protein